MSKILQIPLTTTVYKTVGEYIKDHKSPAFPFDLRKEETKGNTPKDFDWEQYSRDFVSWLPYDESIATPLGERNLIIDPYLTDSEGRLQSNFARIVKSFKNYPDKINEIKNILRSDDHYLNMPIRPGTVFNIPVEKISRISLLTQGIEVVSNNEPAFKAQKLLELEQDLGYKKTLTNVFENIKHQTPDITVWVWCRSLNSTTNIDEINYSGQIFNITPFITDLQSSITRNGGNFSIKLSPVLGVLNDETGLWELKGGVVVSNSGDVISKTNIKDNQNSQQFLFHNIINSNDLVFIRYETLELEEEQRIEDNKNFIVDKINLPGRIYDMIGLVDSNSLSENSETNDVVVLINGRDLSKLFVEDGTYYYSMESKNGVLKLLGESTANNEIARRIAPTGAYLFLGNYYNNSIEEILTFVIQQMSNITVVPTELFDAYSNTDNSTLLKNNNKKPENLRGIDRRNVQYNPNIYKEEFSGRAIKEAIDRNKNTLIQKKKALINKISEFRTAEFKPNYYISNTDIKNTNDSVFDNLYNFIKFTIETTAPDGSGSKIAKTSTIGATLQIYNGWKQCVYLGEEIQEDVFPRILETQNNFLGLSYTYTDDGLLMFNDKTMELCTLMYDYILTEKGFKDNSVGNVKETKEGIWQIIKLVIDKNVSTRLVIDASVSSAQGSIMNFIKKIAQEPFVEMFFDTYGDEFYIIVRQPPTDRNSMISYLTNHFRDWTNVNDNSILRNSIVEIEDIDVVNKELVFDDSQVYSWYHFTPKSAVIAASQSYTTAYIPAIYFEEYAKIWGSKPLDFTHNYLSRYLIYKDDSPQDEMSTHQKQMFYDMKYVIESSQYLPFSRKGQITIIGGDRRIKIGNPIKLKSTNEIFWVDSVSNSFSISGSINRVTTIQVSRGLNETFIRGVKGSELNEMFKNKGYRFTSDKMFSYFDIINTELDFTKKKKIQKTKKQHKKPEFKEVDNITENLVSSSNIITKHDAEINKLQPDAQPVFRNFIKTIETLGFAVTITSGFRTYAEQEYQFKHNKGAKPGTSAHEFGRALDINVTTTRQINNIPKGTTLRKSSVLFADGSFKYGNVAIKYWENSGIVNVAKSLGLVWGGRYNKNIDCVHFQLPKNFGSYKGKEEEKVKEINTKQQDPPTVDVEGEVIEITDPDSVFSNFKVDTEIFNFFLNKQQVGIVSNNNIRSTTSFISEEQKNMISKSIKDNMKLNKFNNV